MTAALPCRARSRRAAGPGLAALLALSAACGPAVGANRAAVPAVDPLSGLVSSQEVDLPGAELAAVRGPAGVLLVGAAVEKGRLQGGAAPDCAALRRGPTGAALPASARCSRLLGAYAALARARAFLLSAGAEALPAAPILVDLDGAAAGVRYLPGADAFSLVAGPVGARVPASLNLGAVTREMSLRQLRGLLEAHGDEAAGVALFLGAAAAGDPGYLAASEASGDPAGELDLSRPLGGERQSTAALLAGALWAWADASGDTLGAARAALAAARALEGRYDGGPGAGALLSLVAGQLNGAERDQACAVFRARLGAADLSACP